MLDVRDEYRLGRAVRGPVDDLEGQPALAEAAVKALQRREAALGARHEGEGAAAAVRVVILFTAAANEQKRPDKVSLGIVMLMNNSTSEFFKVRSVHIGSVNRSH